MTAIWSGAGPRVRGPQAAAGRAALAAAGEALREPVVRRSPSGSAWSRRPPDHDADAGRSACPGTAGFIHNGFASAHLMVAGRKEINAAIGRREMMKSVRRKLAPRQGGRYPLIRRRCPILGPAIG